MMRLPFPPAAGVFLLYTFAQPQLVPACSPVSSAAPVAAAASFHEYQIEWMPNEVRFLADGKLMRRWRNGIPKHSMRVMANAWWPKGLPDPEPHERGEVLIDWIRY